MIISYIAPENLKLFLQYSQFYALWWIEWNWLDRKYFEITIEILKVLWYTLVKLKDIQGDEVKNNIFLTFIFYSWQVSLSSAYSYQKGYQFIFFNNVYRQLGQSLQRFWPTFLFIIWIKNNYWQWGQSLQKFWSIFYSWQLSWLINSSYINTVWTMESK